MHGQGDSFPALATSETWSTQGVRLLQGQAAERRGTLVLVPGPGCALAADPPVAFLIFRLSCKPCVFFMPKSNANQTAANAGLPLGDLGSVQLSCFLSASPGHFMALSGPLSLTEATHGTNLHLRLQTRLLLTNSSICNTRKPTWKSLLH